MENSRFKKGDRVFDIMYGWGEVINIEGYDRFCVEVLFDDNLKRSYLFDALYPSEGGYPRPVLSFTEYKLEGFTRERPEELPNKGDIVWGRNEFPDVWHIGYFIGKRDKKYLISSHPNPYACNNTVTQIAIKNPYENEIASI